MYYKCIHKLTCMCACLCMCDCTHLSEQCNFEIPVFFYLFLHESVNQSVCLSVGFCDHQSIWRFWKLFWLHKLLRNLHESQKSIKHISQYFIVFENFMSSLCDNINLKGKTGFLLLRYQVVLTQGSCIENPVS